MIKRIFVSLLTIVGFLASSVPAFALDGAAKHQRAVGVASAQQYVLAAVIRADQKKAGTYNSQTKYTCAYAVSTSVNETGADSVGVSYCKYSSHSNKDGQADYAYASMFISTSTGDKTDNYTWFDIDLTKTPFQVAESPKGMQVQVGSMVWTSGSYEDDGNDLSRWKDTAYNVNGTSAVQFESTDATAIGVNHPYRPGAYLYGSIQLSDGNYHTKWSN